VSGMCSRLGDPAAQITELTQRVRLLCEKKEIEDKVSPGAPLHYGS
jgi:hypothetical protein